MKFRAFSHGDIRHMSGMYASHKPMTPTAVGDHRRREFEPTLLLTFANDKFIVAARWRLFLFTLARVVPLYVVGSVIIAFLVGISKVCFVLRLISKHLS